MEPRIESPVSRREAEAESAAVAPAHAAGEALHAPRAGN